MRFLQKAKTKKTYIVVSDIHLGAGPFVKGKRNPLEDFFYDKEFVEFLEYFKTGSYSKMNVELVINGDLFDLLAVPYVNFFDDEFWSEEASLEKLKIITKAHPEVMESLVGFCRSPNKKIIYQLGNHDGELVFKSLQDYLYSFFDDSIKDRFLIVSNKEGEYSPESGILIKHGHDYEMAHTYDPLKSIYEDEKSKKFFIPPWGSYYVTRVVNKFKEERKYVNQIRPIKAFLIRGLVYDPLFTLRFIFSTCYYFFMVRFSSMIRTFKGIKNINEQLKIELNLFYDLEDKTRDFFKIRQEISLLIVGHTHEPFIQEYPDGQTLINTGTWTEMQFLDMGKFRQGALLTFAQIDVRDDLQNLKGRAIFDCSLNIWKGQNKLPYDEMLYSEGPAI